MQALLPDDSTQGVSTGRERGLLIRVLAPSLVEIGLIAPSDTLLVPVVRALLSLCPEQSGHDATTE